MNVIENIEFSLPPMFGDLESAQDHQRKVDEAKNRQTVKWAVAPMCSVTTPSGVFREGAAIEPKHTYGRESILRELARRGAVLELEDAELVLRSEWSKATHLVNLPGRSLITAKGIAVHGAPISPEDFARPAEEVQTRVSPAGVLMQLPAKEADDGTKTFEDLISRGMIVPNPNFEGAKTEKKAASAKKGGHNEQRR